MLVVELIAEPSRVVRAVVHVLTQHPTLATGYSQLMLSIMHLQHSLLSPSSLSDCADVQLVQLVAQYGLDDDLEFSTPRRRSGSRGPTRGRGGLFQNQKRIYRVFLQQVVANSL